MSKYWRGLSLAAIILVALPALAVSTLGRMELDWPDFNDPGGAGQVTTIQDSILDVSDNSANRVFEGTAVADGVLTTFRHNFGLNSADLQFFLYTGTGSSKVFVNPAAAGYTIADNGANPKLEIDITAPGSGGPHDFTLVVSWSAVGASASTSGGTGASTVVATAGVAIKEGEAVYGIDDGAGGLEAYPFEYGDLRGSRLDNGYYDASTSSMAALMNGNGSVYSPVQDYNIVLWPNSGANEHSWYLLNRLSKDAATGETKATEVAPPTQYRTSATVFEYSSLCANTDGTEILHLFVDQATGDGSAQVVTPGVSALTFETPFAWETTGTITAYGCAYDPVNDNYGVFWTEGAAGSNVFAKVLSVTGTTVTGGAEAFSLETGRANPKVVWSGTQGKFFIFYYDGTAANEIQYYRYANTDGSQITSYDTEQVANVLFEANSISSNEWSWYKLLAFDDDIAIFSGKSQEGNNGGLAVFDMGSATPVVTYISRNTEKILDIVKSVSSPDTVYALMDFANSGPPQYFQIKQYIVDTTTKSLSVGGTALLMDIANQEGVFMQGGADFEYMGVLHFTGFSSSDFYIFPYMETREFNRHHFVGIANSTTLVGAPVEITLDSSNYDASNFPGLAGDPAYIGYDGRISSSSRPGDYQIGTYVEDTVIRLDNNSNGEQIAVAGRDIEKGDLLITSWSTAAVESTSSLEAKPLPYVAAKLTDPFHDEVTASGTADPMQYDRGSAFDSQTESHFAVWQDQTSFQVRYHSYTFHTLSSFDEQEIRKSTSTTNLIHTGTGAEAPTICSSDDNREHLLLYVDGGDGKAEVITVDGEGVLSFGATLTWEASSDVAAYTCAYDPDNDAYGIFYTESNGATGSDLFSRVLTVAGTTISAPNPRVASGDAATRSTPMAIWDETTSKFLVTYWVSLTSYTARLASTDGSQITTFHAAFTSTTAQDGPPILISNSQRYTSLVATGKTDGNGFGIAIGVASDDSGGYATIPEIMLIRTDPATSTVYSLNSVERVSWDNSFPLSIHYSQKVDRLTILYDNTSEDATNPFGIQLMDIERDDPPTVDVAPVAFKSLTTITAVPVGGASVFYDEALDGFGAVFQDVTNINVIPFYLVARVSHPHDGTFPYTYGETNFLGIAKEDAAEGENFSYVPNNGEFSDSSIFGRPGESAYIGYNRKVTWNRDVGPSIGVFKTNNTVAIRKDRTKISLQYKLPQDNGVGADSKLDFEIPMSDNTYGLHMDTNGSFTSPRKSMYYVTCHATIIYATAPSNTISGIQIRINSVVDPDKSFHTRTEDLVNGTGNDEWTFSVSGMIEVDYDDDINCYYAGASGTIDEVHATYGVASWMSIQELDW